MRGYLSHVATILLARHGETDWNRERRWQGHADPPLNARGRAQARELALALADEPIEGVYASDLSRARETAEIVASARGVGVVVDRALREIDVGEWTGLTTAEIEARYPEGYRWHLDGGDGWARGEPHAEMSARIVEAIGRIAPQDPESQVLCVLHGGVIRALLARAEGVELARYRVTRAGPVNGGLSRIAVQDGAFRRID
jgi:probable phosphoglycerate mutase